MPSLTILGREIQFPFPPYPTQTTYMESVLRCLEEGTHGLLESPTGTGKTLCLLCASLTWLAQTRSRASPAGGDAAARVPCRVVYCSRTHAQLAQVVRELRRVAGQDGHTFTMALLGSREHMCVNREVVQLPSSAAKQSMCSVLRAEGTCRYFRGVQSRAPACLSQEEKIHDMEDLLVGGRRHGFCPYYYEREQAREADIVLLPYNYVLDPVLRKQLPFELKNAILVIDEAHNVPGVLSAAGCLDLHPLDLSNAIHDCARAMAMQRMLLSKEETATQEEAMAEQEFASLKIVLSQLEECIAAEPMDPVSSPDISKQPIQGEVVREGAYMRAFLQRALITAELFHGSTGAAGLNEAMNKAVATLLKSEKPASGLVQVQSLLSAVFSEAGEAGDDASTRFVLQARPQGGKGGAVGRSLGFWQLDNAAALQSLAHQVRSMLLTSGTLSPLDHFAAEVGIDFAVRLRGSHVIEAHQVWGSVLCRGPDGERLNGGYAFRNGVGYRASLGMSLVNLCRQAPGGTLVFFPSYTAMEASVSLWRAGTGRPGDTQTVWGMLSELKPVFVEPTKTADLPVVVGEFQKAVDGAPGRGALLLAVCRGKISEGVNFSDHHGRCVVVTGIPYANHTDLFVRLKREYLTAVAPHRPTVQGKPFTGDHWYRNEAMRAVNQCVGRVIRHREDFGAVLLADERFADQREHLSEWIGRQTIVHREFRDTYTSLCHFFAAFRPLQRRRQREEGEAEAAEAVEAVGGAPLPGSAALARTFAQAAEEQARARARVQQRQRWDEAQERPTTTAAAEAAPVSVAGRPLPGRTDGAPPRMRRQSVADVLAGAPEGTSAALGRSSKDFCVYLKARLSAARYADFKEVLKAMAALRTPGVVDLDRVRAPFAALVERLSSIFHDADGDGAAFLWEAFARHIPEEFRSLYTCGRAVPPPPSVATP